MSTWQIFSDAGNGFRWDILDPELKSKPREQETQSHEALLQRQSSTARLPSMADLLFQGCSELLENGGVIIESSPMFRTGLGKSVVVKQSSIAKALSVLGDGDYTDTGQPHARETGCSSSNSLFQTGSGKVVNISPAGLVRAKTILGLEESNSFHNCKSIGNRQSEWQNSIPLEAVSDVNDMVIMNDAPVPRPLFNCKDVFSESELRREDIPSPMQSELCTSALKPPPIEFHTAGGRSLSVSSDALQRARSLLGDTELGIFFDEEDADDPVFPFSRNRRFDADSSNKKNDRHASFNHQRIAKSKHMSKSFVSPLRSVSTELHTSAISEHMCSGSNLIADGYNDFDKLKSDIACSAKSFSSRQCAPHSLMENSLQCGSGSRNIIPPGRPAGGPLVDISVAPGTASANKKQPTTEKRRLGKRSSISPFKRPRSSQFCTPLKSNSPFLPNGLPPPVPEDSCCKRRVSTRYPFQVPRMYIKEYFECPPHQNTSENLSDQIRWMNPDTAEKYMFHDGICSDRIGVEAFCQILAQSGATIQHASKEWVANHYKWIVWKLACYERSYVAKSARKFLTVSNVLEELKYRYEREVNHGHRSVIKRILGGDALPSSMMVLCISAIHSNYDPSTEAPPAAFNGNQNDDASRVELTDGWYSVDAVLDGLLSKLLASGKLFVGQKLRIWGAGLSGWVGPTLPFEVPRAASLLLHMNGTYRAHWADRLGLCKGVGAPLALRCINSAGGPVPRTLVGVKRIYPVLFKERLNSGGSIVRSKRMETKMMQLYNQRRSIVVEGIISEFERGTKLSRVNNDNDGDEGARILKILETAAEPEILMAEMSSEQLTSFATYQAKLEAIRQSDMQKSIEKALNDAGLSGREVTPFMRVRVVGLTSRGSRGKGCPREGLITIWNPTEKQQFELLEGQAYVVAGLNPLNSNSDTLYLQARGSTTRWQPLSPSEIAHFEPFFSPRKSISLSNLGEVPLSSEFDIAALVLYVGEVYSVTHQKKQWVFVTDGSISELQSDKLSSSLLAISFCCSNVDDDSFSPVNHNLTGSSVGFCNLIKRAKDQLNHLWVAEATENSTYFLSCDLPHCSHLKNGVASAQRWAKISSSNIEKLKERILFIVGNCEG